MVIFCSLPVAFVSGCHIEDTVGVDIKGDFDLRHSTWRCWNAVQSEIAQHSIVFGHGTFALVHLHIYRSLVVGGGREGFRLARWDGGVAFDELGHHPTQGFIRVREA